MATKHSKRKRSSPEWQRKPLSPEWARGEELGRKFVRGLRGGTFYMGASAALDRVMKSYPDALSHGAAGFCDGIAKEIWRRQRRARHA